MADNQKNLLNTIAGYFASKEEAKPKKLSPEYVKKNRADIAQTFQYSPENDLNQKLKKMMGADE